jgi:hypothetical protein
MRHLNVAEARAFAARWLPAWTGNDPQHLVGFYADDAFYLDPAIPQGVTGRAALLGYFQKLLARYPDWVWTQIEAIPLEDGFLNKWLAEIPTDGAVLRIVGVCFVQLNDLSQIKRNEVYFDRSTLLRAIDKKA